MKKTKKFAVIVLTTMIMFVLTGCVVKAPVPEVKEGRFDFSVTFEINGEEKTYSGVYVCKYDCSYVTFVGKGIIWDAYIENGDRYSVIKIQTIDQYEICIDMDFDPDYFMSDPDYYEGNPEPYLYAHSYDSETDSYTYITDPIELFENYGVKLISYSYADPIENSYNEEFTNGYFEPTIN